MVGAVGVVFGDIGTSPLYALQECLSGAHGVTPTRENVLGVTSLIFWAVTFVVTIKYLFFLMRADNRGEGGIMALLALVPRRLRSRAPGRLSAVALLAIGGAALLYGDGVITPAISVLSAMEGLQVASPVFKPYVVPLTVAILAVLFALQSHGTGRIGRLFGPVMVLWFITIAVLGVRGIVQAPEVLLALSPTYALSFFADHGLHGAADPGLGGAGGDRRRGAVRRHGPLRPTPDPHGLAGVRLPGAGALLPGAGGDGAAEIRRRRCAPSSPWSPRRGGPSRWWRWRRPPPSSPRRR